jgi:hypothetical protein
METDREKLIELFKKLTADMSNLDLFELQNVITDMELDASCDTGSILFESINYIFSHAADFGHDFSCLNLPEFQKTVNAHSELNTNTGRTLSMAVRMIFSQGPEMIKAFRQATSEKDADEEMRLNIASLEQRISSFDRHAQASINGGEAR